LGDGDENKDGEDEMKTSKVQVPEPEMNEEMEKLQSLLDSERRRNEDSLTQIKYLQADFENYRRRVAREVQEIEEFSTAGLVRRLLPVLDDLDRAVAMAGKADDKGIVEGMKMVQKSLVNALESEGVQAIEAVGKPFNPELHEAVEKVPGGDGEEEYVVEELRKGYMFKGKVLRPSAVKVGLGSKRKAEKGPDDARTEGIPR
jgi:molecular chaperone GrpE